MIDTIGPIDLAYSSTLLRIVQTLGAIGKVKTRADDSGRASALEKCVFPG